MLAKFFRPVKLLNGRRRTSGKYIHAACRRGPRKPLISLWFPFWVRRQTLNSSKTASLLKMDRDWCARAKKTRCNPRKGVNRNPEIKKKHSSCSFLARNHAVWCFFCFSKKCFSNFSSILFRLSSYPLPWANVGAATLARESKSRSDITASCDHVIICSLCPGTL